ncbi:hypothetical protein HYQ46_009985 [Verticillium longisporum]|nr:hypothetical protein HYQ46_009985 [Verticillium longisporum]
MIFALIGSLVRRLKRILVLFVGWPVFCHPAFGHLPRRARVSIISSRGARATGTRKATITAGRWWRRIVARLSGQWLLSPIAEQDGTLKVHVF